MLAAQAFDRTRWEAVRRQLASAAKAAVEQAQGSPAMHLAAGDRALARGDYEAAVACMYRAVDLDPTRADSLQGLAVALVAAGRFREAVPAYEGLLGRDGRDRAARFNLALALARLGDYGRAEQEYRKLLDQHEDFVEGWYNLAALCQAQGKLHDARAAWQRVVRLAPQIPSAHSALAEVLMDLGKSSEAMPAFAEAAKLRPREVGAWLNLAEAARSAGSYGRAVVALDRAAELAPLDADVYARKGELLLEMHRASQDRGLLAQAVDAWRKSLRLDPSQGELREKLRAAEAALAASSRPAPRPATRRAK